MNAVFDAVTHPQKDCEDGDCFADNRSGNDDPVLEGIWEIFHKGIPVE